MERLQKNQDCQSEEQKEVIGNKTLSSPEKELNPENIVSLLKLTLYQVLDFTIASFEYWWDTPDTL